MIVYGDIASGNCYKIKLLLALLGQAHEWRHVNILQGDTRSAEFQQMNPNGKIPVLQLADGTSISESNAILNYLADGTPFLPTGRLARTRVLEWQFFEQYSHEPYIAVARFIKHYLGLPEARRAEFDAKQAGGLKALAVMEQQLARTPYLTGNDYTIADISLYAYTHVAHEGGFSLDDFPAVRAWLARIASHPRHVTMQQFLA
ncbi:glutathione S-transferase family protein [Chitinolyticbacter meiyuanensis]|uniref:glutathione S-transferase family protein n=1 Tax=Chitinolyticbacter meiyuanensis TaxID=682798 RepID=UPI001FECB145|nr:glutathione S-transferase family protein [Chitinolyticbacter meiyuanensis]